MIVRNLKRAGIIAAIALIPLLFFVNVWQSFRYASMKREIARLEAVQQNLLEQNKSAIMSITTLESPDHIDREGQKLGLARPATESFITIQPPRKEEAADE